MRWRGRKIRSEAFGAVLGVALLVCLGACGPTQTARPPAGPGLEGTPTAPDPSSAPPQPRPSVEPPRAQNAPPAGPAAPATGALTIRASRIFAGPRDYPPQQFAAYGIVAFAAAPTSRSLARYLAICEGYLASLPTSRALVRFGVPLHEQMATVWPLRDAGAAATLNTSGGEWSAAAVCEQAVGLIDVVTSREAIEQARRASGRHELRGAGPFLLAWSPATDYGSPSVPVLVMDLSHVINASQATSLFLDWATEIEADPSLWRNGWSLRRLRHQLRLLADKYGFAILRVLGVDVGEAPA